MRKFYLFTEGLSKTTTQSATISKWFNREEKDNNGYFARCSIKKSGIDEYGNPTKKVFHSFRHTFITKCRESGMSDEYIAALVGHEQGLKTTCGYGDKLTHEKFVELIATEIKGLELPSIVSEYWIHSKYGEWG